MPKGIDLPKVKGVSNWTIRRSLGSGLSWANSRATDYAHTLNQMLRARYDAVVQERMPHRLSGLVERFREPGWPAKDQPTPSSERNQTAIRRQPSSVLCPFCLGLGQRPGPNA